MRKLYLFVNGILGNGHDSTFDCLSLTDDGHILGNHICSHMGYMTQDLHDHPQRLERIKKHFGNEPYEVEILSYPDAVNHEGFQESLRLARERQQDFEPAGITVEYARNTP
jgi:hypothetical protein